MVVGILSKLVDFFIFNVLNAGNYFCCGEIEICGDTDRVCFAKKIDEKKQRVEILLKGICNAGIALLIGLSKLRLFNQTALSRHIFFNFGFYVQWWLKCPNQGVKKRNRMVQWKL